MEPLEAFKEEHPLVGTVDLLLPDLQGILRGKRIAMPELERALAGEAVFTSSLYAFDSTGANVDRSGLVWEEGDADRPLALDPLTLRPVPWRSGCGQILGEVADYDGTPFYASPRSILHRIASRFEALGLRPVCALELEFYLLDGELQTDGSPALRRSRRLGRPPRETDVFLHDRLEEQEEFLACVERWCEDQDIPFKGALPEFAPGQFEVNLAHRDEPVQAADEAVMFKRLVKAAAHATGQRATFMAKPFAEHAGSGLHAHVSLVDAQGRNAFSDALDGEERLKHAVWGLQQLMPESMLIFAPNANSYRRFRPMSYAPTAPTWGHNNRTVAVRVPAGPARARRVEHRVAGADANPYLVLAAVLAGILYGLEHKGDPGPKTTGNAYLKVPPSLPCTWDAALAALATAQHLPGYFGDRFCRLYHVCRQEERERFNERITPTEYEWYLSVV
jgi:glutamine synthetase